jgi:hypothetical protein
MHKIQDSVEIMARHLRRAQTEQLQVRRDPDDPRVAWVSSGSIANHWYRVTRASCECPAFTFQDGICKHVAIACHLADKGLLPFAKAGEIVNGGFPSLKTQVQAGWQSDEKPEPEKAPALYEMRQGTRQPRPGTDDARRLAWSYWN